jgi:flagellar hook-length control protein FliK
VLISALKTFDILKNQRLACSQLTGMSLAFSVDMKVPMNNALEINSIKQQNAKTDLNLQGKAGCDNFIFDSLINNLRSETINRTPEQYNNYKTEITNRRHEQSGRNTGINNQKNDHRTEANDRRSERSDKYQETHNQNNDNGSGEINGRSGKVNENTGQTDKYKETDIQDSSYNAALIDKESEQQNDIDAANTVPEAGDLLFSLLSSHADGLSDDSTMDDTGVSIDKESEQQNDIDTANTAPEAGDLLFSLLSSHADGLSDDSAMDDTGVLNDGRSENALKSDNLMSGILNGNVQETIDSSLISTGKAAELSGNQSDTKIGSEPDALLSKLSGNISKFAIDSRIEQLGNGENPEASDNKAAPSDINPSGGSKKDALSFHVSEGSTKTMINEDAAGFEENLINAQLEAVSSDSSDSKLSARKLFNQSDNNHDHIREFQFKEDMAEMDPSKDGTKALTNKLMSEFAGDFNREGSLRNNSNNHAKPARINSENHNVNILGSSHVTHGGGKINEGMRTGSVTVEHENLGKININLSLEKGMVNVQINTSDNAIREFVENNIHQIVDSLSKNDVNVGGFSVALKNHKDGEKNDNGNGNANITDNEKVKEYVKGPETIRENSGLVNIFA